MKGPGLRLELDVRRLWRCAVCRTERHTSGSVTSVRCHFCQNHPPMTLVEPQRADRRPIPPPDMLIGLHPDDVDAPAFVPLHLREPEEQPVEVAGDDAPITAAVAEQPSAAVETPTSPAEAETDVEAPAAMLDDSPNDATQADAKPPRRKKSRRKKRRGRNKGGGSAPAGGTT